MVHTISGDTPVYQLSVNQLLDILNRKAPEQPVVQAEPNKRHVYGIPGLASLLDCSRGTAQRIKDSGKIPYSQIGRKLVFDADAVILALNKTPRKTNRYAR